MTKNKTALTDSELKTAWLWSQEREGIPLAEAYFVICAAIGTINPQKLSHNIHAFGAHPSRNDTAYGIVNRLIKERDFVGRIILSAINAEGAQ